MGAGLIKMAHLEIQHFQHCPSSRGHLTRFYLFVMGVRFRTQPLCIATVQELVLLLVALVPGLWPANVLLWQRVYMHVGVRVHCHAAD